MGDKLREKWMGVKEMKFFSALYNTCKCAHTSVQIVFSNNFENCRSASKMKHCTKRLAEMSKIYQRVVMYKILTIDTKVYSLVAHFKVEQYEFHRAKRQAIGIMIHCKKGYKFSRPQPGCH